jgi:hypothetical protein
MTMPGIRRERDRDRCAMIIRTTGRSSAMTPETPPEMTTPEIITLPDAGTVAAYETTHYFAQDTEPVLLRIGDPADNHRAWLEKMGAQSATILTAWNPLGEEKPPADNERAQEELLSAIRARELRWLPATGEDPAGKWDPEPGFCVFDAPDALLDEWLLIFRQNAAVRVERERECRLVWHPAIRAD